ncbi:MAG: sensor histidine kinase, partial [Solimonas sp.]
MPTGLAHIAVTLASIESLGLAALLLRVQGVAGLRLLVAFLVGVAIWGLSCELPSWFGSGIEHFSSQLVGLSSLTSAVFFHFVLVLCGVPRPRWLLPAVYALATATTLAALVYPSGRYEPWHGFERFFMPNPMGWVVGVVWAVLAIAGHLLMFFCWWRRIGPPRGQLVAMCMASGWGALCMSGYSFAPLGIDLYPYPLLALPLYPLILVYGILRYELMVVNAWARRGLAWALVVGLGSAAVIGIAALPLPFGEPLSGWRLWLVAVSTLLLSGLLLDPFRRLATRLVYPGSHLAAHDLEQWQRALAPAESHRELGEIAAREISRQLRVAIAVQVGDGRTGDGTAPTLHCHGRDGRWRTELIGWDAAPPGPRYVAQLFGATLADAAQRLEQALAMALRERQRQQQERLAELGALAATVAHDIRNPLNIIAMAAASAPPDVRQEIATQTSRISQLATDLLDYAKSWQINPETLDLADFVRTAIARYPEVVIGDGLRAELRVSADTRRLRQVLLNLLDNARAAVAANGGGSGIDA